jgi:hypothetical protein
MSEIETLIADIANRRAQILEDFTRAYLAETGLRPSECELCERRDGMTLRWYFRKRESDMPTAAYESQRDVGGDEELGIEWTEICDKNKE